jgi:hypothetical protein
VGIFEAFDLHEWIDSWKMMHLLCATVSDDVLL